MARYESVSPELALVDPELRARALDGALHVEPDVLSRPVQWWVQATTLAWIFVAGLLVGGKLVPHGALS